MCVCSNMLMSFYFILQPNPTKGKMRIHCLENVDKSLTFLNEQRVHLENMGAHDIVDGNPRLTLGLIWTIILRFQVRRRSLRAKLRLTTSIYYVPYEIVSLVDLFDTLSYHIANLYFPMERNELLEMYLI